jgi:hypothetical protein
LERETRVDGVDADGDLADPGGSRAAEDGDDVLAGFGFFGGGDGVFEVVGEGVDGGDLEGLFEEAEGGARDWR